MPIYKNSGVETWKSVFNNKTHNTKKSRPKRTLYNQTGTDCTVERYNLAIDRVAQKSKPLPNHQKSY